MAVESMFGKLCFLKRASRSLAKTGFSEALKAWYAQCFRHISGKLGSRVRVPIPDRIRGHSGVPFGSLLGSFLGTLGALWATLGSLGRAWG